VWYSLFVDYRVYFQSDLIFTDSEYLQSLVTFALCIGHIAVNVLCICDVATIVSLEWMMMRMNAGKFPFGGQRQPEMEV